MSRPARTRKPATAPLARIGTRKRPMSNTAPVLSRRTRTLRIRRTLFFAAVAAVDVARDSPTRTTASRREHQDSPSVQPCSTLYACVYVCMYYSIRPRKKHSRRAVNVNVAGPPAPPWTRIAPDHLTHALVVVDIPGCGTRAAGDRHVVPRSRASRVAHDRDKPVVSTRRVGQCREHERLVRAHLCPTL